MKKMIVCAVLSLCLLSEWGYAEVEEITILWSAFQCQDVCVPEIERNLTAIRSVNNLQINSRSGAAVMGWDPNYPFSYEPFRNAFAAVGISIVDMRIRVRGRIAHDRDDFYLVSNGDVARFLIVGPLQIDEERYIPRYNLASYPLTATMKTQLLDAEAKRSNVTISGPLYLPSVYPRTLIAEQVVVSSKENKIDSRYQRY